MLKKISLIIVLGLFLISGCTLRDSIKEYRAEKIQLQHPNWDEITVQKTATRQVEIGMTADMVAASLGQPDSITRDGDEEKWGYAIQQTRGLGDVHYKFVYFVYIKNGLVIKTVGNRRDLATLSWYE